MKDIRLDKYVASTFNETRSGAKLIIKNKRVEVNGVTNTDPDYKIKETDIVKIDGKEIKYEENIYLMMNKPKGYISATTDNRHKTVFDLIKGYNINNLKIVGRLDIDTTGLLLITTDGDFVHALTSPNKDIYKTYKVLCDKEFTIDDVTSFKEGITIRLDDETLYQCKESKLEILENKKEALISIREGKFHQIKKMCKAVGKEVLELKRISIGPLVLDETLEEGKIRPLTEEERELFKWFYMSTVPKVKIAP